MEERYLKNYFDEEFQNLLLTKHIGVIGCGGNGGYVVEFLVRLGVKEISLWDGDSFEESNLNRQIYCNLNTLSNNKAIITGIKAKEINDNIKYHIYNHYFSDDESDVIYAESCDIIIDCADLRQNWRMYRYALKQLLRNGKIIIKNAIINGGIFVKIYTLSSLKHFDMETGFHGYRSTQEVQIPQSGYLCALAASITIEELIKAVNNIKDNFNKCIILKINPYTIQKYPLS